MIKQNQNCYKASRLYAGITQEQAAEALGIATRTLSDYENGHVRPHDDMVLVMMDVYGCPPLGYLHMYDSALGKRVLTDIQLSETNGCMVLQTWNAQSSLRQIVKTLKKIFRGKSKPEDLCEASRAKMVKKIDLLEQVRGEVVAAILYLRKIAYGEMQSKRKESPSHKRPRAAA